MEGCVMTFQCDHRQWLVLCILSIHINNVWIWSIFIKIVWPQNTWYMRPSCIFLSAENVAIFQQLSHNEHRHRNKHISSQSDQWLRTANTWCGQYLTSEWLETKLEICCQQIHVGPDSFTTSFTWYSYKVFKAVFFAVCNTFSSFRFISFATL